MINETQTRNVRAHVNWTRDGAHMYAWCLIMIVRAIYNKRVYGWADAVAAAAGNDDGMYHFLQ